MDANEMLKNAREAYKATLVEALSSADEALAVKLANQKKAIEELEAMAERENSKAPVAKVAEKALTESQKFVKNLCEAVALGTNFTNKVPNELAAAIVKRKNDIAKLRGYCTVHQATGDYTIVVDAADASVAYVGEGAQIGETTPQPTPVKLSALKLACIVKVSNEFIADISADVIGFLTEKVADAFATKEDTEILNGTGSGAMTGIIPTVGSSGNLVNLSSATMTWTHVKTLIQSLGAYRENAKLVMTRATADTISLYTDANGSYIFPQNQPLTNILGCEIVYVKSMPSGYVMVGGDFSYYHIAERLGMDVTVLNELYADYDQTGIRVIERIDGAPLTADAFAVMKA